MKDKNRILKIINGLVVSSLFSIAIGFIVSNIYDLTVDKIPVPPIYFVLVTSLVAVLLTAIILFKMETVDEYRYEVTKLLGDGFVRIYRDSISEFATTLVNRSKYIRVVGTARQDVVNSKSVKGAKGYLRALENKLSKSNTEDTFTYLRVVPRSPAEAMKEHIQTCSSHARINGHNFEARINLHFPYYISFTIFDNTDLLIILDNKEFDKKNDNALCLWTRNKEIIEIFIKRFDNGWEDHSNDTSM